MSSTTNNAFELFRGPIGSLRHAWYKAHNNHDIAKAKLERDPNERDAKRVSILRIRELELKILLDKHEGIDATSPTSTTVLLAQLNQRTELAKLAVGLAQNNTGIVDGHQTLTQGLITNLGFEQNSQPPQQYLQQHYNDNSGHYHPLPNQRLNNQGFANHGFGQNFPTSQYPQQYDNDNSGHYHPLPNQHLNNHGCFANREFGQNFPTSQYPQQYDNKNSGYDHLPPNQHVYNQGCFANRGLGQNFPTSQYPQQYDNENSGYDHPPPNQPPPGFIPLHVQVPHEELGPGRPPNIPPGSIIPVQVPSLPVVPLHQQWQSHHRGGEVPGGVAGGGVPPSPFQQQHRQHPHQQQQQYPHQQHPHQHQPYPPYQQHPHQQHQHHPQHFNQHAQQQQDLYQHARQQQHVDQHSFNRSYEQLDPPVTQNGIYNTKRQTSIVPDGVTCSSTITTSSINTRNEYSAASSTTSSTRSSTTFDSKPKAKNPDEVIDLTLSNDEDEKNACGEQASDGQVGVSAEAEEILNDIPS